MKLNAKTIASAQLPPGKNDHIFWDSDLACYGLRLRRGSGGKLLRSLIVQYKRAGATRRFLIGSADVLSADQARAAAKQALAAVQLGRDVQAERVAVRNKAPEHSLRAVIDLHLADRRKAVRPGTFRDIARYLTGPYFAPLHRMPIGQVTRRDVAARLSKITNDHSPIVAAAARNKLTAFFAWAMAHGLAEANPVIGTLRPRGNPARERVLSDDEMVAIWRAADVAGAFSKVVKLLMLCGNRRQEVGGMAWSELNLETGEWRIPGAKTKNKHEHVLWLPSMALDIIRTVPRLLSRDLLFGEYSTRGFAAWDHYKRKLDAKLGDAVKPWTIHDLRRSVATKMADIGIQPYIIEQVLNHRGGHKAGIAGIYNRSSYEREVKAALALWAEHVRALVEGGEKKVVPLRA